MSTVLWIKVFAGGISENQTDLILIAEKRGRNVTAFKLLAIKRKFLAATFPVPWIVNLDMQMLSGALCRF